MKLTACKKCHTPVIRWDDVGLTRLADITALTPHELGLAWLNGQTTYRVHTLYRLQWANLYRPSPNNRHHLANLLRAGQPSPATVLVAHTCGTQVMDMDRALDTWQGRDLAALRPAPKPTLIAEGIPF